MEVQECCKDLVRIVIEVQREHHRRSCSMLVYFVPFFDKSSSIRGLHLCLHHILGRLPLTDVAKADIFEARPDLSMTIRSDLYFEKILDLPLMLSAENHVSLTKCFHS